MLTVRFTLVPLFIKTCVDTEACNHGAGLLFHDHIRTTRQSAKSDKKKQGTEEKIDKKEDADQKAGPAAENDQAEGLAEGAPASEADGATAIVIERASMKPQRELDVKQRGHWPIASAAGTGCPVLEGTGVVRWREYVWCVQKFIDRSGKAQEKKVQQFQDCSGTRQEFLGTYKRKILEWLPHKQHLQWDRTWQRNLFIVNESTEYSLKTNNLSLGEVEVRIDFIKNAEMRSPVEAQREYFIHQYLSLLCAVVQWKTLDEEGNHVLRTRTYMFCSDDHKHDGAFASHCLKYLAEEVFLAHMCLRI